MSAVFQYDLFANANPQSWFEHFCAQYVRPVNKPAARRSVITQSVEVLLEKGDVCPTPSLRQLLSTTKSQVKPGLLLERACRENRSIKGLQLPGFRCTQIQLAGSRRMDLIQADFQAAQVSYARLWVNLSGSQLMKLQLDQSDCHGSRLVDCDLQQARMTASSLNSVSFCRSNLRKAAFTNCELRMCDFFRSNLSLVSFKGCDLSGSDFRQADLTGCDLRGSLLRGVSIPLSTLETANTKPIRQRIQDLASTYPAVINSWLDALRTGRWQAINHPNLSSFMSDSLGYRVGAGWPNAYGSTEWIIWQFLRSIQPGEYSANHSLAQLLHRWIQP